MALYLGDVQSNVATSTNTIVASPNRVRGISFVAGAGAGSIVFKDGGASGTTKINIATAANSSDYIYVPGDGVRFGTNTHVTLTNITSVTVFYG